MGSGCFSKWTEKRTAWFSKLMRIQAGKADLMEPSVFWRSVSCGDRPAALMAGLLEAHNFSKPRYRKAMLRSLQTFKRRIKARGAEASLKTLAAKPHDTSKDHLYTLGDLVGLWADDEVGGDDD